MIEKTQKRIWWSNNLGNKYEGVQDIEEAKQRLKKIKQRSNRPRRRGQLMLKVGDNVDIELVRID